MRLLHKMVAGYLVVTLLIAVVAYVSLTASESALRSSIDRNSQAIATGLLQQIERHFHSRVEQIELLTHDPALRALLKASNERFAAMPDVQAELAKMDAQWERGGEGDPLTAVATAAYSRILADQVAFYERKYSYRVFGEIFVTNRFGGNVAESGPTTDYVQSDEEWWEVARDKGLYVGPVIYDESAKVHSTDLALRIDSDGAFIGVIKAVVNVSGMVDSVKETERRQEDWGAGRPSYTLLTTNGRVIYSSAGYAFMEPAPAGLLSAGDLAPGGAATRILRDGDGADRLTTLARSGGYHGTKGLDWRVVLEYPVEEAFRPIHRLRVRLIVLALAVGTLAVVFGWFVSRSISGPIARLRQGVHRIGEGHLDYRVGTDSTDEVGELSRSFDAMTDKLAQITVSCDILTAETAKRREVEASLRLSEERFRLLVRAMTSVVWCADMKGRFVGPQYNWQSYTAQAWLEQQEFGWIDMFHPDDRDLFRAQWLAACEEGSQFKCDARLWNDEAKAYHYVEARAVPMCFEDGSVREWVGTFTDVDAHRRAEDALARSEQLYRMLIETMTEGLTLLGAEGRLTYVNERFCEMMGYSRNELVGRSPAELLDDSNRAIFEREFSARRSGAPRSYELDWLTRDGTVVSSIVSPQAIYDEEGSYTGAFAIITDITDRRLAELANEKILLELDRSNRELEEFAYVASHDLQEPLRMVSSYMQLLEKRYKGKLDADADEFIHFAVDGAQRMQRLIKALLLYSRVGTRAKAPEPIACAKVLDEVRVNLKEAIEQAGATVTNDPLPVVTADETQLAQLLQNLVANGIKFRGEAPPEVHISAERQGSEWRFSVRDNGIGIAPEHRERIFMIFQRLHARDDYEGTGIGLAVCKKIVERHGGRIWLESEVGKGTTFFFTIPAGEEGKDG